MGIEDVRCPTCGLTKSALEMGTRGDCLDCEAENERYDRFQDERMSARTDQAE